MSIWYGTWEGHRAEGEPEPFGLNRALVRIRDHLRLGHDGHVREVVALMNALSVGSIVVVLARLPSNALTISANPAASVRGRG